MPVFQAVLTGLAAFGGAKGAFRCKKARREGLGRYPGAAQMVGHRCIFHLLTPLAGVAVPLRYGEPPKTKKGRRREPQAFLGRSSRIRRKKRRGV